MDFRRGLEIVFMSAMFVCCFLEDFLLVGFSGGSGQCLPGGRGAFLGFAVSATFAVCEFPTSTLGVSFKVSKESFFNDCFSGARESRRLFLVGGDVVGRRADSV